MKPEPTAEEFYQSSTILWENEIVRRFLAGEYLTKIDTKEAKKIIAMRAAK